LRPVASAQLIGAVQHLDGHAQLVIYRFAPKNSPPV
jgi:hypothetical protein